MRALSATISVFLTLWFVGNAGLLWADRAEGSFERALSVSGPVQLQVSTSSGGIVIRKGAAGSVRIQARITAQDRFGDAAALVREVEQNPPIRQTGNIITIGNEVRRWDKVGISYDLTVPQETQADARTGSGNVDIYDLRGPVEASTGSGGIRAENIGARVQARTGSGNILVSRTGGGVSAGTGSGSVQLDSINGAVDAQTGSGNITVSGASGAVRARTGSGNVRVEKAQGEVDAQASSGGVTVDGSPKSARWDLRTGSGSVRVSLPPGTPFELDAHTGSGSITTSHPITVSGTVRKNELRGVAIRPDNRIFIRTGSGAVRVD